MNVSSCLIVPSPQIDLTSFSMLFFYRWMNLKVVKRLVETDGKNVENYPLSKVYLFCWGNMIKLYENEWRLNCFAFARKKSYLIISAILIHCRCHKIFFEYSAFKYWFHFTYIFLSSPSIVPLVLMFRSLASNQWCQHQIYLFSRLFSGGNPVFFYSYVLLVSNSRLLHVIVAISL